MARFYRMLRLILAAATIALALFLCLQFADIYYTDASSAPIYSREIVFSRLRPLLWMFPFYIVLALATAFSGRRMRFSKSGYTFPKLCRMPGRDIAKAKLHFFRIAIMVCAVFFILLGVMNGGARDVLIKAINICTECIGLG